MTAQQLKNSILQMAVQGKLVPQDPNDEPASVLLERIRKEKEKLIKEGKIKKEKNPSFIFRGEDNLPYEKIGDNEPVCIADEVPFEIPESWEWCRLGDIFQHNTGKALNSSNRDGELLEYITTSNLYWNRFELDSLRKMYFTESEIEKCTVSKGDLLVCEGGDIGRSAIWNYDYDIRIQNHIHRLRAYMDVCTEYFYYLFYFFKNVGLIGGKGIGIQGLSANTLHNLLFPLPPVNEQKRIVEQIKIIKPYTDRYAEANERMATLNSTFPDLLKKSILQQAVMGKLVPQNENDEPASVLLERIRAEKEALTNAGKLKKDKHESIIYRRDNSHYEKRDGEEVCIDDEIPFEIPDSWMWMRLSSFGIFSSGKTPSMSDPKNWHGKIPWITSKDMKKQVITDSEMHITDYAAESMQVYPKGTLLLVARSGILRRLLPLCVLGIESTINQDIKAFSLYDLSLSNWLFYALKAFEPMILHDLVKSVTTVESLKFDEFSDLLIPVPPLKEQARIIKQIQAFIRIIRPIHYDPLFSL